MRFFTILFVSLVLQVQASETSMREITVNVEISKVLRAGLSSLADASGSIVADQMICRGRHLAYECDVYAGQNYVHLSPVTSYRVFRALSTRLNPNLERSRSGRNGLYNLTVFHLACSKDEVCRLSTSLDERIVTN